MDMRSDIKSYTFPNGEIQRVQVVRVGEWSELEFLHPDYSDGALDCFSDIYSQYLVPKCPWIFGTMVMFHLPEGLAVPFSHDTKKYGCVSDGLTASAAALEMGVRFIGGRPVFRDEQVEAFWHALEARGCLRIIRGRLPITTVIPVGSAPGYLSRTEPDAALKVNASFFIMDRFDCATVYDHVGTPFGLCVRDGVVLNPPLFRREALLAKKDGSVTVSELDVRQLELEINGKRYAHGKNAVIHSRPDLPRTPPGKGMRLVIIGCRVAAVQTGGSVRIPASGFVLCPEGPCAVSPGDRVTYLGLEDVRFGIQVGNSIVRDGEKTVGFRSRFYNIFHLEPVPFPPSLYPMNFKKDRAARIALGADREGKPMLLWAEGAGKLGRTPGRDSRGASLQDMARFCCDAGMVNAVNLDGGGSAQILMKNRRVLLISDRNKEDGTEAERPVPLGLMVR